MSRKFAAKKFRLRTHTRFCTIRQRCKFAPFVYDQGVSESLENKSETFEITTLPAPGKPWDYLIWPRWLPTRARLPLMAQLTGAAVLLAAVAMPTWQTVGPAPLETAAPIASALPSGVTPAPAEPARPAHLNLEVRHNFKSVDLTVTVDGASALDTKIAGTGRKFGVFGKRGEKGFTATLDLEPGARVVRVRVRSAANKFDQTRVERFDLGPASVASMRILAEDAGLSVFADRPPAPPVAAASSPTAPPAVVHATPPGAPPPVSAAAELYHTLRQSLIAIAGFVASAATGYLVQEFLRARKRLLGL
jgi:hypothetical protein